MKLYIYTYRWHKYLHCKTNLHNEQRVIMRAVSFMNIKFGAEEEANVMADPDAYDDYLTYTIFCLRATYYIIYFADVRSTKLM